MFRVPGEAVQGYCELKTAITTKEKEQIPKIHRILAPECIHKFSTTFSTIKKMYLRRGKEVIKII